MDWNHYKSIGGLGTVPMVVENMVEECLIPYCVQPWNMFWIIRLIHAHFVSTQPISLDGLFIMGASSSMKPWFKEDL
jgi:hypothetical protein